MQNTRVKKVCLLNMAKTRASHGNEGDATPAIASPAIVTMSIVTLGDLYAHRFFFTVTTQSLSALHINLLLKTEIFYLILKNTEPDIDQPHAPRQGVI